MGDQFCLKWNNHQNTLISVFDALLGTESLVDCTLVAGGQFLKGHKVVLSACSPLLETLLGQHSEKHPILILKDIKFHELRAMMDYMYRGEVNISQDQLDSFLRAAESLQIKGLTDQGGGGDSKGGGGSKSEAAASPPTKRRRRASPEPEEESQASDVTSDSKPYIQPHVVTPHISTAPIMPPIQTSNSQPQDRLKTEPPDIITPKQEYIEGQHSDVEDLTLDDEEEYTMDMATQPGTSHGPPPNTPQTFSNWQAHTQALDRTNDEVFMAAQNAINNQNNAQDEDAGYFHCRCGRKYKNKCTLNRHRRYECGKAASFPCPLCPYKCKQPSYLNQHIKMVHSDPNADLFYCPCCPYTSKKKHNLKVHVVSVHSAMADIVKLQANF